ncbi:MAG: alanine racemase [Bacteroidota bacterium]
MDENQTSTKPRRHFIVQCFSGITALTLTPKLFGQVSKSILQRYHSQPWLELSKEAYLYNAAQISKMAGDKPVMAVLKNNAYGLGDVQVAKMLNGSRHIMGVAVVKDGRAIAIREGGVTKPILLMGDFDEANARQLVDYGIVLSVFSQASFEKIQALSALVQKRIQLALYIDTGLGRMGIPYAETMSIAKSISKNDKLEIVQTFSTLTTPKDFANEQIQRFNQIIQKLEEQNISYGAKHLAPSYSLLDIPDSHQDVVRPGILVHGSFPLMKMEQAKKHPLKVPFRLKAMVIRLERLKPGDTIGFSRFYKVEKDEWIATLPVGWADGYDSGAENGAKVLLGDKLYPVVNINASHTNVSLGSETDIQVGDVATLIGPDQPEITPEGFAKLIDGNNYLQINYKESIPKKTYETF